MRPKSLLAAVVMVMAACGGGTTESAPSATDPAGGTTSTSAGGTTSTSTAVGTTQIATPATIVSEGTPVAEEGDNNETVAALQFLLNCGGHGTLTVDGAFGPATLAAVQAAQAALGRTADGAPDEATFGDLARACTAVRQVDLGTRLTLVGNVTPGDSDSYLFSARAGTQVTASITPPAGLTVSLRRMPEGVFEEGASWTLGSSADYLIEVKPSTSGSVTFIEPVTYELQLTTVPGPRQQGDWVLATDGFAHFGSKVSFGDDAETVIATLISWFGTQPTQDSGWAVNSEYGWNTRSIDISGFTFGFRGPDAYDAARPETFEQWAYAGSPDHADYHATTPEGIGLGDTAGDLQDVYGDRLELGSVLYKGWFYRLEATGDPRHGTCFYIDTPQLDEPDAGFNFYAAPTDSSPIISMANASIYGVVPDDCRYVD